MSNDYTRSVLEVVRTPVARRQRFSGEGKITNRVEASKFLGIEYAQVDRVNQRRTLAVWPR